MKVQFIQLDQVVGPAPYLEMYVKFTDDEQYHSLTLTIEDYVNDTPAELADSLQKWVDAIRETGS